MSNPTERTTLFHNERKNKNYRVEEGENNNLTFKPDKLALNIILQTKTQYTRRRRRHVLVMWYSIPNFSIGRLLLLLEN